MTMTPTQLADALSSAVIAYVGDSDEAALQESLRAIWTGNGLATEDLAMGVSELVGNVKGWMRFGPVSELTAAASVDLGGAATHLIMIAGDTSITSFGDSATVQNPIFEVKLAGSPLLVHSADLQLPGEEDIQGSPGDAFMVEALGDGAFKVWFYFRSDGSIVNSAIAATLEQAVETVQLEGATQVAAVGAAALAAIGGVAPDIVPPSAGFDGGWAITDENGWTTDEKYFRVPGIAGQVTRWKVPGVDWSVATGAIQIVEPPPVLPYDINIFVVSGQSNAEDADSVPMMPRTPSDMVQMLDAVRPRHFGGTFGLAGFTQAVGVETIVITNHWGGNLAPAIGDMVEQLIEEVQGQTYAEHGRIIVPVLIGMSSSSYAQIGYGSAHFTTIINWFTAALANRPVGKTMGIVGGAWLHGADSYDTAIGYTASYNGIKGYWDDVQTHLQEGVLGETAEFPVGIVGSHAHLRGADQTDTYVANAENQLCVDFPDRFNMVNGEGQFFFAGRRRGFGGSGVHHSAREGALIGAHIGWWLHTVVSLEENWNNCIPTFTRTGANQVTMSGLPDAGYHYDFYATGLAPTVAQANHGWFFYDPAAPTTELALSRPPYPGAGGTLIADFVSALPTNLSVRYGARATNSTIAGNDIWKETTPVVFTINGEDVELHRNIPALNKVIP